MKTKSKDSTITTHFYTPSTLQAHLPSPLKEGQVFLLAAWQSQTKSRATAGLTLSPSATFMTQLHTTQASGIPRLSAAFLQCSQPPQRDNSPEGGTDSCSVGKASLVQEAQEQMSYSH